VSSFPARVKSPVQVSGMHMPSSEHASMTSSQHSHRTLSVLRRPISGPLLFGFVLGGIPFGIALFHLGLTDTWGDQFFTPLTPVAVLLAALGANLGMKGGLAPQLRRAFLTSLGACIPVPTITWTALAWRSGFEILDLGTSHSLYFFLCCGCWRLPLWAGWSPWLSRF
jgi:hypothetical protein